MTADPRAQLTTEIWLKSIRLYFRLQAMGKELGAVSTSNASTWGLLHTLMTVGPSTVPDMARMRPVSRQHIQTLANEMAEAGLVSFSENPRHKKSKLVSATETGIAFYKNNAQIMLSEAAAMVGDLTTDDLETTARVLDRLRAGLEDRQSEPATLVD